MFTIQSNSHGTCLNSYCNLRRKSRHKSQSKIAIQVENQFLQSAYVKMQYFLHSLLGWCEEINILKLYLEQQNKTSQSPLPKALHRKKSSSYDPAKWRGKGKECFIKRPRRKKHSNIRNNIVHIYNTVCLECLAYAYHHNYLAVLLLGRGKYLFLESKCKTFAIGSTKKKNISSACGA